jgi:hypothetical protein
VRAFGSGVRDMSGDTQEHRAGKGGPPPCSVQARLAEVSARREPQPVDERRWRGTLFEVANALEDLETTEDAGRDRPSRGPAWDAAIAAGIDVTLLEHRLRLLPFQRIREHLQHAEFAAGVRGRTVPPRLVAALSRRRLEQKLESLNMTIEQVLEPTHGDRH